MRVSVNIAEVERGIQVLRSRFPPAFVRSINRGAGSGQTVLVRETSRDMKLPNKTVRERITTDPATFEKPRATIKASAKPVPAIDFGAKGPEPSRGKGRGVTTKLPSRRYPHAFITRVGVGRHRGVFERVGKARLPIREIKGPSVWFVAVKHVQAAAERMTEQTYKNLQHELTRIFGPRGPR